MRANHMVGLILAGLSLAMSWTACGSGSASGGGSQASSSGTTSSSGSTGSSSSGSWNAATDCQKASDALGKCGGGSDLVQACVIGYDAAVAAGACTGEFATWITCVADNPTLDDCSKLSGDWPLACKSSFNAFNTCRGDPIFGHENCSTAPDGSCSCSDTAYQKLYAAGCTAGPNGLDCKCSVGPTAGPAVVVHTCQGVGGADAGWDPCVLNGGCCNFPLSK